MTTGRFGGLLVLASIVGAGCGDDSARTPGAGASGEKRGAGEKASLATDPPVFEERAEAAGLRFTMRFIPGEQGEHFKINLYDHGCGVAVVDYDGDGRDDLYFCNQLGRNALFHNDGGGKFSDVTDSTEAALGVGDRICAAATFGDYDGDGRPDLFVTSTRGGNLLFHNDGGGKFTDVTKAAGVAHVGHSETGTFFDADGDGDLDLLVTNTANWTTEQYESARHYYVGPESLFDLKERPVEHDIYYRNQGNGTFVDATKEAGLAGHGWDCECAVFDADGDGDVDLFVTSMFGDSALYANDGRGRFTEITQEALGRTSYGAQGARAFDFDLDGRLDLIVADMHSDMWDAPYFVAEKDVEETRKYPMPYGPLVTLGKLTPRAADDRALSVKAGGRNPIFGNTLFRNKGGGKFEEVSDKAGVETFWPWGVVPADFRNVGAEDVFLPSGMGSPFIYWPNRYLQNRGDGTFLECAKGAGLDPPPGGPRFGSADYGGKEGVKSSRCAATADFDGDGRIDLVVGNFNESAYLYMNRTPPRHWIAFRLAGTKSNREAIGALVTIIAGGRTRVSQVQAGGGYLSQSSKTVHFGLGDATRVESCTIRWPSGIVQQVTDLATDALHDVTEPAAK